MIHLLYANSVKLLKTTRSRLLKEQAYVDKKGDKLKEVNVDEVNTQLTSDKFRTKQGKPLNIPTCELCTLQTESFFANIYACELLCLILHLR